MLEVQSTVEGGSRTLQLVGELDIATVDVFRRGVENAREGAARLVLDMAKLSFVDSTGVGGLLNVIRSLKNEGIEVKGCNVSADVYEVFDLLGLPLLLGKDVFA